ncbi:OmpH family outer membrane protein [Mangrovibacterium marinum]|uniref:Periplasmic chaperone for outer membrane proteins Skp n=1 Tax=Mangrovibacterium marinum TaxID=1639118 RepID=A0A2T5C3Z5_9BACT|nr:OmpH family outer membrane protein [Mangrovibacterium marinum]PTN09516.1 periplasmic chaperone for outer membrane proteins Skp [Mangrovibacterium marinum]
MKNVVKICLVAIMLFSAGIVKAQNLKFAHIDSQALIQEMPETAAAQKTLEAQAKGLEDQLASMQKEFQDKVAEYTQKADSLTDIVRQAKEEDLQNLQQRIQTFNQSAQQKMQQKQAELMQPILKKANETIEVVAKEQGVIYVFDSNAVLYKSNASIDLLPLVKAKLGM